MKIMGYYLNHLPAALIWGLGLSLIIPTLAGAKDHFIVHHPLRELDGLYFEAYQKAAPGGPKGQILREYLDGVSTHLKEQGVGHTRQDQEGQALAIIFTPGEDHPFNFLAKILAQNGMTLVFSARRNLTAFDNEHKTIKIDFWQKIFYVGTWFLSAPYRLAAPELKANLDLLRFSRRPELDFLFFPSLADNLERFIPPESTAEIFKLMDVDPSAGIFIPHTRPSIGLPKMLHHLVGTTFVFYYQFHYFLSEDPLRDAMARQELAQKVRRSFFHLLESLSYIVLDFNLIIYAAIQQKAAVTLLDQATGRLRLTVTPQEQWPQLKYGLNLNILAGERFVQNPAALLQEERMQKIYLYFTSLLEKMAAVSNLVKRIDRLDDQGIKLLVATAQEIITLSGQTANFPRIDDFQSFWANYYWRPQNLAMRAIRKVKAHYVRIGLAGDNVPCAKFFVSPRLIPDIAGHNKMARDLKKPRKIGK